MNEALLWVDSRYFIQGEKEIEGTEYRLMKLGTEGYPSPEEWLSANLSRGEKVGVAAESISIASFSGLSKRLSEKGIVLEAADDLLSPIWNGRPSVPCTHCWKMDAEYSGLTAEKKLAAVRDELRKKGVRWTFISSLDDIAWITNLRADDVPCSPVFVSYLFISLSKAVIFIDKERFDRTLLSSLRKSFEVRPYENAVNDLRTLAKGAGYYSPERNSQLFAPVLSGKKNVTGPDISTGLKAEKNEAEMKGMRLAHIYDAAAYVNFLSKLDRNGRYDEAEIASLLEKERKKIPGYIEPSFEPISAFRENGAMCHYRADEENSKAIDGEGLLVLDTGSQFSFGTTDITRTLLFGGEPSDEERRDYTLVLKGHLALSRQKFPKGTRGVQLDVLAKQFLWQYGENFFHGTGHGVGCLLNVHEGPQRISSALIDVPLRPRMVISDEPGVYREGKHGIRIENLIAVKEEEENSFGVFYSFEVLTLVPYEKKLIDLSLLTDEEIDQINAYHSRIYSTLKELVEPSAARWLEKIVQPLRKGVGE